MTRIAHVGLSGPLLYDYEHPAERGPADTQSSPNPILDSPYGLLLLYDEIWFLSRSLCPQNMRELGYVRFLDEEGAAPDLANVDISLPYEAIHADPEASARLHRVTSLFSRYDRVLRTMRIDWTQPDNHTHGLRIGSSEIYANAVSLESLAFDLETVDRLSEDVDLVPNSFAQRWLDVAQPTLGEVDLAHALVLDHVPNWIGPRGPYHPVVEEARENSYLKAFRSWVSTRSLGDSLTDVQEIKAEVEEALRVSQRDHLLRYLEENRLYLTQGKAITGAIADLLQPGVGTASSVVQNVREGRRAGDIGWQGFLLSLDELERGS